MIEILKSLPFTDNRMEASKQLEQYLEPRNPLQRDDLNIMWPKPRWPGPKM